MGSTPSLTNPALNRVLQKPGIQDLSEVVDYFYTQKSPYSTQLGRILDTFRNNDASILSSIYDLIDQVNALTSSEFGGTGPPGPPGPPGPTGPSGPGPLIPTQINIVGVQVSDSGAYDQTGQPMKSITVSWSYPVGWNGNGVYVFNDYPDSSGVLLIADGTNVYSGGTPLKSTFNPKVVSPFTPYDSRTGTTVQQFSFLWPAPTANTFGRVYITAGSASGFVLPVQYGLPGASPSAQYTLTPRATANRGGEQYAPQVNNFRLQSPLPAGWSANPNIVVTGNGDQFWQVALAWDWPTNSPAYARLGGVQLVLDDTFLQTPLGGHILVGKPATYVSALIPIPRGGAAYTIWADDFDVNNQQNTIVSGVTPSVSFTISRASGPAGLENTSLVVSDGVHPFISAVDILGNDGSHKLRVTGWWKQFLPGQTGYDPSFGGAQLVVEYSSSPGVRNTVIAGSIPPIQTDIQYPASATSATFYLRSYDVNGNPNSIVPGTTPSLGPIPIGGGTVLNLTYTDPTFISNSFAVFAGLFQINTKGIQRTHIADNAIDTPQLNAGAVTTSILTTSEILIGGGGGKPVRFRIYDNGGSPIAWIGDDSINTGAVGGWFKQLYIGGPNPSGAVIVANSAGNVSISGASFAFTNTLGYSTLINNVTGWAIQVIQGSLIANISPGFYQAQGSGSNVAQMYISTGSGLATVDVNDGSHISRLIPGQLSVASAINTVAITPGGFAYNGTALFTGTIKDASGVSHSVVAGMILA